jgi:Flp pilus assembly pilin Flp
MRRLTSKARTRVALEGQDGAAMVEYAFLIALIAMVVLVALIVFGPQVRALYEPVMDYLP